LPKKVKTKVEVEEIFDADVRRVSLVERGANMIPWRILKSDEPQQEESMDFGNLFGKKAEPRVSSIAISADANLDQSIEVIKSAGYSVDNVQKHDDVTVFVQDGSARGEQVVVKLDDNHAIVVSGLDHDSPLVETKKSFAAELATAGFIPGVEMACAIVSKQIVDSMFDPKAAKGEVDYKSQISMLCAEFKNHIEGLVAAVPQGALKMAQDISERNAAEATDDTEESVSVAAAEDATADIATQKEDEVPEAESKDEEVSEEAVAKSDESVEEVEPSAVEATEDTPEEVETEQVAKSDDTPETPDQVEGFEKQADESLSELVVKAIGEALAPLKESIDALGVRVETVEKSAAETAEHVNGTVVSSETERVVKNTNGLRTRGGDDIPTLDTGEDRLRRGMRPGLRI
jgi:hypothetical protein